LTFLWEPDIWGKVRRSTEAARAELLAAEENRRAVMLKVVTGVATGYVRLLSLDQQLDIVEQIVKNRQRWLDLLESKYKGGMATLISVERARADVEAVRAVVPEIERQISEVENDLSSLVGDNPGSIARGTMAGLKMPVVPRDVPSDVLVQRPDVLAAEQDLVAANARIGAAKAAYLPTFSLSAAIGLGADDIHWLLASTAHEGQIGRGLTGPIFSAGRIAGTVAEAEAVQREKEKAFLQSVQTALHEIENSLVARVKTAVVAKAQARQVMALQEVARLTRRRFEGGQADYLSVLDAERQVFTAQEQQNQGLRQEFGALVSVYKAMGGGWMVAQDRLRGRIEPSEPKPAPRPQPESPSSNSSENSQ
jgi:outer membrane protein, multidrug efflux system